MRRATLSSVQPAAPALDVDRLRRDFPILSSRAAGKPLVYLDSAASTQKPAPVIEAMNAFYREGYSNIHRGLYALSLEATEAYEQVRCRVQRFINAREAREVVFVRGTTEAINLVAGTLARQRLEAGDEILISTLEHHSNIVPWQRVCEEKGGTLRVAPIDDNGEVRLADFEQALGPRTRLVAIAHVSNALGTVNPVAEMVRMAHRREIPVLVDGAQAAPHLQVDVQALDCDFYAFSGHKVYGPTGVGVLYGKASLLEAMPPYQSGGEMIRSVSFERTSYKEIPDRFEAGTPDIVGVIGLGAALDYLDDIGLENIAAHESELLSHATEALALVPGVRVVGRAGRKAGVLSFVVEGAHPHDIGTILDREGIAIRGGHHCAQPLMERLGLPATARASFGLYNSHAEVDRLADGVRKVREIFGSCPS